MNEESAPSKPFWLRKLRRGVSIRFNGYDNDGIPHWLIFDEGRNKYFVVGWPEYEMLSRWNLADPEKIIAAVNSETTLHIDMKDFEALEWFLHRNYLVEQRWRSVYQKAREQKLIKGENIFYWFVRYYLFFRIPLFNPDNFLDRTKIVGDILFSPITLFIMSSLGLAAIYQIGVNWEEFIHTFSTIFSLQGLILYFLVFSIAKCIHEFGHAYMAKQYGVKVPTMGVAFLVFWPVLYTDTTQSWSLPSHQRIRIALAGMWVETYLTIIAALIWANVHNVVIQMICYLTVAINWVGTLLINVSPFMRFDGYYVFSDILKVPNLQPRSFALARWQIRKWLFDWDEAPPEAFSKRMHWTLVIYAIITWLYRLVIYFGIAVLVYHYFFKLAGIILFMIELFAFIFRPVVVEIQHWYEMRRNFSWNRRTIITLICAITLLLLLLLPIQSGIKMQATMRNSHEFVYAKKEAILETPLPVVGTQFKANEMIAKLTSPELEQDLKKTRLEYEKIQAEIRRAALDPKFSNQTKILQSELAEKKTRYDEILKQKEELNIKAPFDGVISDVNSELRKGSMVIKNGWILDIINPLSSVIEAYVDQSDLERVALGDEAVFYPANLSEPKVSGKIIAIEPINAQKLSWQYGKVSKVNVKEDETKMTVATPGYHASELGGKIPTDISDRGEFVPIESIFRVLMVPQKAVKLQQIELGTVILKSNTRNSFVYHLFYKIKRVFVQERGF